jgi:hypothetical protein
MEGRIFVGPIRGERLQSAPFVGLSHESIATLMPKSATSANAL